MFLIFTFKYKAKVFRKTHTQVMISIRKGGLSEHFLLIPIWIYEL